MASTLVTVYRFVHRWQPYNYFALLLVFASMTMLIVTYTRHTDITGNNNNSNPTDNSSGCHFDYSSEKWINCPVYRRRWLGDIFELVVEEGVGQGIDAATSKSLLLTLPILDGIEG